jgi:hypothetical protein
MYLDTLVEYLEIIQSPKVERESVEFRQIYGDMLECSYENLHEEWERAHNINPYLAASVMAGLAYCNTRKYERQVPLTVIPIVWCTFTNQECIQTNGTMKVLVLDAGEMNCKQD